MGDLNNAKMENERLMKKIVEMEKESAVDLSRMMEMKKNEFDKKILSKQKEIDDLVNTLSVTEKTSKEDKDTTDEVLKTKSEEISNYMELLKEKEGEIQLLNVEKRNYHENIEWMSEECTRLKEEILAAKEKEIEIERKEKVLSNTLEKSSEFQNLLDGIVNVPNKSSITLTDDPLATHEDLPSDNGISGDKEEEANVGIQAPMGKKMINVMMRKLKQNLKML